MTKELLPEEIRTKYEVFEWRHACSILKSDFPEEWDDLVGMLQEFTLPKSFITTPGGSKSQVSHWIEDNLGKKGWTAKNFDTQIKIDDEVRNSPTHEIDCFKNRIALEIEWNNKDPFFDRDLNNFRLLFDLGAVSVGVIITRSDELQDIFKALGRGPSYGASTTHISKLLPRIEGGGGAGCPLLVIGITKRLYDENS